MNFTISDKDLNTKELEAFELLLEWQKKGWSYTSTGYGSKIPTRYMVKHNKKMKRVYCMIYSNIGMLYIMHKGDKIILN